MYKWIYVRNLHVICNTEGFEYFGVINQIFNVFYVRTFTNIKKLGFFLLVTLRVEWIILFSFATVLPHAEIGARFHFGLLLWVGGLFCCLLLILVILKIL